MLGYMEVHKIIELKLSGKTERAISNELRIDRKTIRKYWHKYCNLSKRLEYATDDLEIAEIQAQMSNLAKYDSTNRKNRALTQELYNDLNRILEFEEIKSQKLGSHKQQLTVVQIYEKLQSHGHKISYSTLAAELKKIRGSNKECYILQNHKYGMRLEYDFGEVKFIINGKKVKLYMAVFSAPASNFRWCYLYENSKQDVFLESHVRFFKMINGVWDEVVYDNMRNVVTKFLGKSQKELNKNLINMANYYGFKINVTNAFSGNEKGHVENSVKTLRNKLYAQQYEFESIEELYDYTENHLIEFNANSKIEEEKQYLTKAKQPYELSNIRVGKVDKCSIVQVDNNKYSVPDYLVGQKVTVKLFRSKVMFYANNEFICCHKRLTGKGNYSLDVFHYLKTFKKKPNALKNSIALEQNHKLRNVYDKFYYDNPKAFIEILDENKNKNEDKIIDILTVSKEADKKIEAQSYSQIALMAIQLTKNHNDLLMEVM